MVFSQLRLPAAWLVAALIGSGVVALMSSKEFAPPTWGLAGAQGIIGLIAAEPLIALDFTQAKNFTGVAMISISTTLGLSVLFGALLAQYAKNLGYATAALSLIAGGASTIAGMARELGADQRYVTLSQYLRLAIVIITLPAILAQLGSDILIEFEPISATAVNWNWVGLLGLASMVLLGGKWARLLRLPAPFLLGPLLVTVVLVMIFPTAVMAMHPPIMLINLAYVVIGWQAGATFSMDSFRMFVRLLPITIAFIGMTVGGCFLIAMVVARCSGVSLVDAYLATTPGGIYAVLAAAHDAGSGPIVVTLQILRMLVMVLFAALIPMIIRIIEKARVIQRPS